MRELEERRKRYTKMLILVHNLESRYGSMMRVPDNDKELKKLRKLANLKAYEDDADKASEKLFRYRVDNWAGFTIHFARLCDVNMALFDSPNLIGFKAMRKKLELKNARLSVDRTSALKPGAFYVEPGSAAIKQVEQPVGKVVA